MRIDMFVTCVGKEYAAYLERALPIWLDTCDSVTIVTDKESLDVFGGASRFNPVFTDLFYEHGASFNKGAALSHAFALVRPTDWVLHVDADIVPEPTWRKTFEATVISGKQLYCAKRYEENGKLIPDWPEGCGFFQLWNVRSPRSWRRPVWEPYWISAGNYDASFLEQWPETERVVIPIRLTHLGEPRRNWFGANASPKLMETVHKIGLRRWWLERCGKLDVPEPMRIHDELSAGSSVNEALVLLNRYSDPDPFKYEYQVTIGGEK